MRVVILDPPLGGFGGFYGISQRVLIKSLPLFLGKTFSRGVLEKFIIFPLGVPPSFLGPPEYPKIPDFWPFFKIGD